MSGKDHDNCLRRSRRHCQQFGGTTIISLRFSDDIDDFAGEVEELAEFVERLDKASTAYGREISAEKTKWMSKNTSGITKEINANGQKLETVTCFKHVG